jgi:hypothetical protein
MILNSSRMLVGQVFLFLLWISVSPLFAESFPIEETLEELTSVDELIPAEEELILIDETLQSEETSLTEEITPDEEILSGKGNLLVEEYIDTLVFEAPDLVIEVPVFEPRSFNEIFPEISLSQRRDVMSSFGLRNSFERDDAPMFVPDPASGIDLISRIMRKRPSHITESLVIIPYNKRELDMLDIYNAMGRIEKIKEQILPLRSGNTINLFKDTTRLESAQNRKAVPDPSPADTLPFSETIYLRLTDYFIGDLYIQGDMSISLYGMTYNMTNFRDIHYSIFRIMRADRISIIIYLEPVKEGILIYSMSGFYLPGFIVKRMHLTSNINARIILLTNWITEGLRIQENIPAQRENDTLRGILLEKLN